MKPMKTEIRKQLLEVRRMRKEQYKLVCSLADPFKDNIALLDRVLKNEVPVEHYIKYSKRLDDWFEAFRGLTK